MAILTLSDQLTAVELIKRGGFTEDQRTIIEVMSTVNEMLYDAPVEQANDGTKHTGVVRTALPHGQHRTYNEGVKAAASQTKTFVDVTCELSSYSVVDAKLVHHSPDSQQFLTNECVSFIEGMGQDQGDDMIYGNHENSPKNINGLAIRRNKIDNKLCIDAGGTGDNLTSLYLIKWGHHGVKYIYPRGASGMAVKRDDRGLQDVEVFDDNGKWQGKMPAFVNYFSAEYGLTLGDERSLIRVCNIDPTMDGTALAKICIKAMNNLMPGGGTVSMVCNKDVKTIFDIAAMEKNNVIQTREDPWGRAVNHFREARIRRVDAILGTESRVS